MMAIDDDEEGFVHYEEETEGTLEFAHWLEDRYSGDHRFEMIELCDPGTLDGEDFRLRFILDTGHFFLVAVNSEDGFVRVGFATQSEALYEELEESMHDAADSMSEFLAEIMGLDSDLEYEMQQFEDDVFYYCSDILLDRPEELAMDALREDIVTYLDGYFEAFFGLLGGDEDEDAGEDED